VTVELLVDGAELVATLDADDREISGGWVALDRGLVVTVGGPADPRPAAARVLRADGCLVTPGLVNTHHHIYQNLTRAHRPSVNASLFTWLTTLYPLWAALDEEAVYVSTWIGLAELAAGVGVAHCPSSHMLIGGGGMAPVAELRAAGAPVGLGCDGSASTDHASLWLEARTALLLGHQRKEPTGTTARDVLDIATRGSAACLGRAGELGTFAPGAVGDLVCWPLTGIPFAGALTDPVEAWLRCGPVAARHTVVAGRAVVEDAQLVHPGLEEMLRRHSVAARRIQRSA
jgi:cytosine/adenosine deaminase-related metal-dependent hydrolase